VGEYKEALFVHAAGVLVVDGDLAQDISHLSRPREVLVRGTPADLT
jgi:hypothetical protein